MHEGQITLIKLFLQELHVLGLFNKRAEMALYRSLDYRLN